MKRMHAHIQVIYFILHHLKLVPQAVIDLYCNSQPPSVNKKED